MIATDIKAARAGHSPRLLIGQDRGGHWVVKDAHSLCGGLFTNRNEAIRFAMYECQRRPQSVIMLPDGVDLDGPFDEGPERIQGREKRLEEDQKATSGARSRKQRRQEL